MQFCNGHVTGTYRPSGSKLVLALDLHIHCLFYLLICGKQCHFALFPGRSIIKIILNQVSNVFHYLLSTTFFPLP